MPMPRSAVSPLPPVFRSIVRTVVPDAANLDDAAWTELDGLVLRSLRARPPELQRRVRLFLRLIQWLPLFRFGRPLTLLSSQQQERFLLSLQGHRIGMVRVGFWGIRTLALLGYYGRRAAADAIGYRPDRDGWEALR